MALLTNVPVVLQASKWTLRLTVASMVVMRENTTTKKIKLVNLVLQAVESAPPKKDVSSAQMATLNKKVNVINAILKMDSSITRSPRLAVSATRAVKLVILEQSARNALKALR